MQCGWLNVQINLKSITDAAYVQSVKDELLPLLAEGSKLCDEIYEKVTAKLG